MRVEEDWRSLPAQPQFGWVYIQRLDALFIHDLLGAFIKGINMNSLSTLVIAFCRIQKRYIQDLDTYMISESAMEVHFL